MVFVLPDHSLLHLLPTASLHRWAARCSGSKQRDCRQLGTCLGSFNACCRYAAACAVQILPSTGTSNLEGPTLAPSLHAVGWQQLV